MEEKINLTIEGKLENTPELYYNISGKSVCLFSIDGNLIRTHEQIADYCEKYLKKGSRVRIKGFVGSKLIEAENVDFITV